jgi:hypothetical protein
MIDIAGVNIATMAKYYSHLRLEHGQFRKIGDTILTPARTAQGKVGPGIIIYDVIRNELRGSFRGDLAIINARSATLGNGHQRLQVTGTETPHLNYLGIYFALPELNIKVFKDFKRSGGATACGGANIDTGNFAIF